MDPNINFWITLFSKMMSNSQNSMISFEYSWCLAKNLSNFVSHPCKLHNRYCHTAATYFPPFISSIFCLLKIKHIGAFRRNFQYVASPGGIRNRGMVKETDWGWKKSQKSTLLLWLMAITICLFFSVGNAKLATVCHYWPFKIRIVVHNFECLKTPSFCQLMSVGLA